MLAIKCLAISVVVGDRAGINRVGEATTISDHLLSAVELRPSSSRPASLFEGGLASFVDDDAAPQTSDDSEAVPKDECAGTRYVYIQSSITQDDFFVLIQYRPSRKNTGLREIQDVFFLLNLRSD